MGLFDKLVDIVVPATIGFATGGPAGAFAGAVAGSEQERAKRKYKRQQEQQIKLQREYQMAEIFGSGGNLTSVQAPQAGFTTQNSGFGAGFGSFIGDVGRNILSPISNIIGAFRTPQNRQQPAITTIGGGGAQETSGSGSVDASLFGPASSLISTAGKFFKSPAGQIITGAGGLALGGGLLGDSRPMKYPTKQVRIVKAVYNQSGRNLPLTAEILGLDIQNVSQMIMQKLPAPNPAPTASAIRKTRSTIRKLDRMCNLRDEIAKSAKTTTRRRAPMRRASTTTLIKN